jgi:hypothetical protein
LNSTFWLPSATVFVCFRKLETETEKGGGLGELNIENDGNILDVWWMITSEKIEKILSCGYRLIGVFLA